MSGAEIDNIMRRASSGGYDLASCETFLGARIVRADVIAGLVMFRGNVNAVARALNSDRRHISRRIRHDETLREVCHSVREAFLDRIEDKAMNIAEAGDPKMIMYLLDRLGKHRGYTTRLESTGKDGKDLVPVSTAGAKERLRNVIEGRFSTVEEQPDEV